MISNNSGHLVSVKDSISRLDTWINAHIGTRLVTFTSLLLAVLSIINHHGGVIHPEVYTYLPYYLSDKPLINKLYDSKVLDQDMYQARELSYFFDYLDSQFIKFSAELGHPHFISATNYLFLMGISLLLWYFSTKIVKLPPISGFAIVLLFWTSPSIFLSGNFFRSAKVGVALIAAILFLLIFRFINTDGQFTQSRFRVYLWLTFFFTSIIMTLFDRQGVYLLGIALCFVLFWSIFFTQRKNLLLTSSLIGGIIFSFIYNYVIGPFFTLSFNQYSPNFSYQHMPWGKFFDYLAPYIWAGTSLYLDTVRFMFGNVPAILIAAALCILFLASMFFAYQELRTGKRLKRSTASSLGFFFCTVALFIGLNALMVLRHTPIFDPDVRRVYYWIPEVTVLYLTLAVCLSYRKITRYNTIIELLLIIAVLGNVLALPRHYDIVAQGHTKIYIEHSPILLDGIRNINNIQYRVTSEVSQDFIYNWFKQELKH
jgi:hypothetical protein